MSQEETIDLQKLTTKELLIQVLGKVETLAKEIDGIKRDEEKKQKRRSMLELRWQN